MPEGDDRPRAVCPACETIHYENPRPVVGCVVEAGERLLLCRRAIEPAHGLWTIPAGYQEIGETTVEGAKRETREEACAEVEVTAPHAFLDIPHIGQTYSIFRSRLVGEAFEAGPESLEVALFERSEVPWGELAFPVVTYALKLFLEDREQGLDRVHLGVLRWGGSGSRFDPAEYVLADHLPVSLASLA